MNNINNTELREALNELYASVVKVIRICAPDMLTTDMVKKDVLAQLSNLLDGLVVNKPIINPVPQSKPEPVPEQEPVPETGSEQEPVPEPETNPDHIFMKESYAVCAEEDGGAYFFRRTNNVKEERGRYFAIKVHTDGYCTFEMKNDLNGEELQTLVDNKDEVLDSHVVRYEGNPASFSRIITESPGEAYREKRSIKIVKPLKIRFE